MNPIPEVITYHMPVENLWPNEDMMALLAVWKRSWEKFGWKATVLTEADIRTHPKFDFFNDHFRSKPSEYPVEFTVACFHRYLAAAHYGNLRGCSVLMSDADVVNYGMEPREPIEGKMELICSEPPGSVFCGALLGRPQHFLDLCELFAAWTVDDLDFNSSAGQYHQDDLTMLSRAFAGTRPKPEWLIKSSGCALYDYCGWRTEKLVHYGFQMKKTGAWPKHLHIERLRPF